MSIHVVVSRSDQYLTENYLLQNALARFELEFEYVVWFVYFVKAN